MRSQSLILEQVRTWLFPGQAFRSQSGTTRDRSSHRLKFPGQMLERLEERCLLSCEDPVTPPHGDNPVLQAEHRAVFNLVKCDAVTHSAIVSGQWDDPAIWDHGLPGNDANAYIPPDVTVTLDNVNRTALRTLRVDGVFQVATDVNSGLMVDTIVVAPSGSFIMGTPTSPVAPGVEAKIILADRGPIDSNWDPNQFSRALISHGTVSMYGAATTSFVGLIGAPRIGQTHLMLDQVPVGWEPGDRLILTGTNPNANENEELALLSIAGDDVTVRALKFNHIAPAGSTVYLANVSRNVVIESQNPYDTARRGHVMFMHADHVDIEYAGFYGLGRTDKRNPLHNVEFDASGNLVPNTGKNQVGRYAVHFHRTGTDFDHDPAVIRGSAVVDSPGWGIVNHSSYVRVEDNVVFDVVGAAYVTETGSEIGSFRRNIAIRSTGSGAGIESRADRQDFGHQGDGFWFQGAGIEVEGNVAVGQRHSGFVYFTRGLVENGLGTARFLAENLVNPAWANGQETIDVGSVPIRLFKNNVAFASGDGFESWFHLLGAKHDGRSVVDGFVVWNTRGGNGLFIPYTNQTTIRNTTVLGNLAKPAGRAIGRNDVTRNIVYDNVRSEGWMIGIDAPVQGYNVIQGGYFNNVHNIQITTGVNRNREVHINGNVQFGTLPDTALRGETQYNIFLQSNFNPKQRDITRIFNRDLILLGTITYNGQQVYYLEQAADFVPFKTGEAADYVPPELLDKTNQQLWDAYGLAVGGVVAPANATTDPRIHGLIGDPSTYLPDLTLVSRKYTNQLTDYQLIYKLATGVRVTDPTKVNLREGWNLITRTIDGRNRTFLVFGDITGPTFQADPKMVLAINPLDLTTGFVVRGTICDNSVGCTGFKQRFSELQRLQVNTRPDGSQYLVISFSIRDLAGNTTPVSLEITIDPNASREIDQGFRDLPPRPVSQTLVVLLGFLDDRGG